MKKRERENIKAQAEERELPPLPFMDGDAILDILQESSAFLRTVEPDAGNAVLSFAYCIGPGLDEETQKDDDVEVLGLIQMLAMSLVVMTATAEELLETLVTDSGTA